MATEESGAGDFILKRAVEGIKQLVYALYGLTPEEISLVAGTAQ